VKILAVDTALGACSVALVKDGLVLRQDWREMARGHAEALAPMVEALMRRAQAGFAEIDRLAVTTGPGTFAGQRVGLAFMRALALALKRPLIGITTLDAMAEAALVTHPEASLAIAAADARRGEIYLGARNRSRACLDPVLVPLSAASEHIVPLLADQERPLAVAGMAAEALSPLLIAAGLKAIDSGVRQPDAIYVAMLGASAPAGPPPRPLYLRPPDARLPGAAP
jgi:tRNA threonylcarbamoyladenosine biosynthesis protein TsaB